ncbi:MAG: hypothetical protein JXA78_19895 [Anaerolineales bacterium]|nr:hypothetical protein [Anaerolineales bacterium]
MKCDRCGEQIPAGEETDYYGQTLCEECYMQALSPARACDPWAVRSAQVLSQVDDAYAGLSETQVKILQFIEESGGAERSAIAQKLQMKLSELERELATLRHMEKIRGEMRGGKKIVRLW